MEQTSGYVPKKQEHGSRQLILMTVGPVLKCWLSSRQAALGSALHVASVPSVPPW